MNPRDLATDSTSTGIRALVCYSGQAPIRWLVWLKPGFRHCFVVVETKSGWISIDGLCHRIDLRPLSLAPAQSPARAYRALGFIVQETTLCPTPRRVPFPMPMTCVEVAKRVLGIHAPWMVTPFALFRFIEKKIQNPVDKGQKLGK